MNAQQSRRRPGFTLVELMTVVAVIILLISILIPALSAARAQAKKAATSGLISALDRGCEMFHGDFNRYPQSRGKNPFEDPGDNILLMGTQWLALQLTGADSRGFVEPTLKNDSPNGQQGVIDHDDWLDWYALNPSRQYTRLGPYADVDAKQIRTVMRILEQNPDIVGLPSGLVPNSIDGEGGDSAWNNGFVPFFVDAWEYPVLYYAANPKVDAPFTTGTPGSDLVVGRYDHADNAFFTGADGNNGRFPIVTMAWDLTGTADDPPNYRHPLGEFAYVEDQTQTPEPRTFEDFVYNEDIFETTRAGQEGRIWPHNPDTFLLIAAGQDGVLGTGDDITNFGAGR